MVLLLEKPTVCKDCQSRSISRKKRPFWLKLVTSSKRLYRCDICGWTVWVRGRSAASSASERETEFPSTESPATEFPATEFPETVTRSSAPEDTRPLLPEQVAPAPGPVVTVAPQQVQAQPAQLSPAKRAGQQELSFDGD
jgi:hypothetical protein